MVFQIILDVTFGIKDFTFYVVKSDYTVGAIVGKGSFAYTEFFGKLGVTDKTVAVEHRPGNIGQSSR
mgnify:CR=1 FL=1